MVQWCVVWLNGVGWDGVLCEERWSGVRYKERWNGVKCGVKSCEMQSNNSSE